MKRRWVVYLSYDGMTDALGESQVLNYLIGLREKGYPIYLISFEKPEPYRRLKEHIQQLCQKYDIYWKPLRYRNNPPVLSTLYNLQLLRRAMPSPETIGLIHCRGYVVSLVGLEYKRRFGIPFIFDMRGFWADEKLEGGYWKPFYMRPIYHFFKKKEKAFFQEADFIVSLTHAGKKVIVNDFHIPDEKVIVIPTCVDLKRFYGFSLEKRKALRERLGIPLDVPVLLYSGSIGGNCYDNRYLESLVRQFLSVYPEGRVFLLLRIEETPANLEPFQERIVVHSAPFYQVADYLNVGDWGLMFCREGKAAPARFPTKIAEYWAMGLPLIAYGALGDIPHLLKQYPFLGVFLKNLEDFSKVLPSLSLSKENVDRLRTFVKQYFSLEKGIEAYANCYAQLFPLRHG